MSSPVHADPESDRPGTKRKQPLDCSRTASFARERYYYSSRACFCYLAGETVGGKTASQKSDKFDMHLRYTLRKVTNARQTHVDFSDTGGSRGDPPPASALRAGHHERCHPLLPADDGELLQGRWATAHRVTDQYSEETRAALAAASDHIEQGETDESEGGAPSQPQWRDPVTETRTSTGIDWRVNPTRLFYVR